MMQCPCGSGEFYEECCQPYHNGKIPETALILMRSRYSAYAKQRADYIIDTTHPLNPSYSQDKTYWKKQILDFCTKTTFERLEILDFQEGEVSYVTFVATLRQNGKNASFKEKSRFEKINGKWLYLSGSVMIV